MDEPPHERSPPQLYQPNKGAQIYLLAQDGDWTELISRCQSHPEEASFVDPGGRLPLHRACDHHPPAPLAAIEALLSADESALASDDEDGKIPLHYAAASGASLGVLRLLIDSHPFSLAAQDKDGWTPPHCAARALGCRQSDLVEEEQVHIIRTVAESLPEALCTADNFGRRPLHLACMCSAAPGVARELLRVDGERIAEGGKAAISYLDHRRESPMHLCCHKYDASEESVRLLEIIIDADPLQATVQDYDGRCCLETLVDTYSTPLRKALQRIRKSKEKGRSNNTVQVSGTLSFFWKKASLLIRAMSECASPDRLLDSDPITYPLLHEAIRLDGCPKQLVLFLLGIYPEMVTEKDPDGNLPLHVAAETVRSCSDSDAIVTDAADLTDVVLELLDLYPEAAGVPNHHEKLPLQLAIEGGRKGWSIGGLGAIYHAHPAALHSINFDPRLLPLFLATRVGADFTEIFLTLRSRPDVMGPDVSRVDMH